MKSCKKCKEDILLGIQKCKCGHFHVKRKWTQEEFKLNLANFEKLPLDILKSIFERDGNFFVDNPSRKIQLAYVRANGKNIKNVFVSVLREKPSLFFEIEMIINPEHFNDTDCEMFVEIVKKSKESEKVQKLFIWAQKYFSKEKNIEFSFDAVKNNKHVIKYISTNELKLACLVRCPQACNFLSQEFIDEYQFYLIQKNPVDMIRYISPSKQMIELAVDYNYEALKNIPPELITDKIEMMAISNNIKALTCVRKQTFFLCWYAIEINIDAFLYIDEKNLTKLEYNQIVEFVINKNPLYLEYVKNPLISDEYTSEDDQTFYFNLCLSCIKSNYKSLLQINLNRIGDYNKYIRLVLTGVEQNPNAIIYVPIENIRFELKTNLSIPVIQVMKFYKSF